MEQVAAFVLGEARKCLWTLLCPRKVYVDSGTPGDHRKACRKERCPEPLVCNLICALSRLQMEFSSKPQHDTWKEWLLFASRQIVSTSHFAWPHQNSKLDAGCLEHCQVSPSFSKFKIFPGPAGIPSSPVRTGGCIYKVATCKAPAALPACGPCVNVSESSCLHGT